MYQPSGQAPFGHLLFMRRIEKRGMGARSCTGRPTNTSTIRKKIPFSRLSLFRNAVRRDSSTVKREILDGRICLSSLFFFYCILKAPVGLSQRYRLHCYSCDVTCSQLNSQTLLRLDNTLCYIGLPTK